MCVTEPFPFGRDCFPLLLTSPVCGAQPERIQGAQYTVKSDVWSLGISLIELALGRFPFSDSSSDDDSDLSDFEGTLSPSRPMSLGLPPPRGKSKPMRKELDSKEAKRNKRKSKGVSLQGGGMTMSILELLQHIVNEPAPKLTPEGRFPKVAEAFVDGCLLKDPDMRQTPKDLLVRTSLPRPALLQHRAVGGAVERVFFKYFRALSIIRVLIRLFFGSNMSG